MTTARNILADLAAFSDLDLPTCRHARLAFAYAKMAQWQIMKKDIKAAMRCAASATRCLARSLEDAAKASRADVDAVVAPTNRASEMAFASMMRANQERVDAVVRETVQI